MGLLDFLKYNKLEKQLLEQYSQMMSMTGIPNAKNMVVDMLDQAIEESKKERTYYLPQNMGDIILGDALSQDPKINNIADCIRQNIPKKKAEGVKDEDIRWWWNLNDIDRRIMGKHDDVTRMTHFISELEKSNEPSKEKASAKAAERVRKFHPMYGDPDDTSHTTGDDRPLPYELKERINIYIEKLMSTNQGDIEFKKILQASSSMNAFLRDKIRKGKI